MSEFHKYFSYEALEPGQVRPVVNRSHIPRIPSMSDAFEKFSRDVLCSYLRPSDALSDAVLRTRWSARTDRQADVRVCRPCRDSRRYNR
jgi:hypothetical protein